MTANSNTARAARPLLAGLGDAIAGFIEAIARSSHAARCAEEAERLFALSDAELARRGLTRDRIIQHAFRAYLSV